MRRRDVIGFLWAMGLTAMAGVRAQTPDSFSAYLDWVPISGSERNDVAGKGSATATLSRSLLSITGTFEGMVAPATRASLHHGVTTSLVCIVLRRPVAVSLCSQRFADGTENIPQIA